MNTKNNRRAQLTKRMFQEALLELLGENHISDISVKALCDKADLNRSTFYAYYQNQMELLREIENDTYSKVEVFIMNGISPDGMADQKGVLTNFLEYIKDNAMLFKVLLGSNGSQDFQEKLMEFTLQAGDLIGIENKKNVSKKSMYAHHYRIAGCTSVIENWIKNNFDISVLDMVNLIAELSG